MKYQATRGAVAAIAVVSLIFVFPSVVRAGSLFQKKLSERLNNLAVHLDAQAHETARVADAVKSGKPEQIKQVLKDTPTGVAIVVKPDLQTLAEIKSSTKDPSALIVGKEAAVSNISDKSTKILEYSNYVKQLSSDVKNVPPNTALTMLGTYVPDDVKAVSQGSAVGVFSTTTSSSTTQRTLRFIVGGQPTIDYPSVADILYNAPNGNRATLCSGTLIAANAVLTAGHCVVNQTPKQVYFQHAGLFDIQSSVPNEHYSLPPPQSNQPITADLAIIFLKTPVTGILPASMNESGRVASGQSAQIIGFGQRDSGASSLAGIKVAGTITTEVCGGNEAGKDLICWTYDQGGVLTISGSTTCFGDSGGPLFADSGDGTWRLAGITSEGDSCDPGAKAWDVEVFDYAQWIKTQLASHPSSQVATNQPQPLQPIGNDQSRFLLRGPDLLFDDSSSSISWQSSPFIVSSQTARRLFISANALPMGAPLVLDAGPYGQPPVCHKDSMYTGEGCDLLNPPAGAWTVKVTGPAGQEFQVVVTKFN